jgi:hypothetical protein
VSSVAFVRAGVVAVVGLALVLVGLMAVCARWVVATHQSHGAALTDSSGATRSAAAAEPPGLAHEDGLDTGARVNLAGDEVSPAVATYGVDREGNLYEVHSPDTEEPRLAPPSI